MFNITDDWEIEKGIKLLELNKLFTLTIFVQSEIFRMVKRNIKIHPWEIQSYVHGLTMQACKEISKLFKKSREDQFEKVITAALTATNRAKVFLQQEFKVDDPEPPSLLTLDGEYQSIDEMYAFHSIPPDIERELHELLQGGNNIEQADKLFRKLDHHFQLRQGELKRSYSQLRNYYVYSVTDIVFQELDYIESFIDQFITKGIEEAETEGSNMELGFHLENETYKIKSLIPVDYLSIIFYLMAEVGLIEEANKTRLGKCLNASFINQKGIEISSKSVKNILTEVNKDKPSDEYFNKLQKVILQLNLLSDKAAEIRNKIR